MKNKIIFTTLGVLLSITLTGIASESANPFNPIFSSTSESGASEYIEDDSANVHPLQQQPVKNYTLIALIASSNGSIAMVRAKNGEEFFVRVNDTLGNADGKITGINKRGIEVAEKDKVVSLLVRNRSVSNDKN